MKSTKDRILDLLELHPALSQADIARALEISRQRVSECAATHGIVFQPRVLPFSKPRPSRKIRPPSNHNHFGFPRERHNPAFIGAAGEMIVAADLMKRGIAVYRSLAPVATFDLVASLNGELWRIECRSAKRDDKGRITVLEGDNARYDVLAMVFSDCSVVYKPVEGVDWILNGRSNPVASESET